MLLFFNVLNVTWFKMIKFIATVSKIPLLVVSIAEWSSHGCWSILDSSCIFSPDSINRSYRQLFNITEVERAWYNFYRVVQRERRTYIVMQRSNIIRPGGFQGIICLYDRKQTCIEWDLDVGVLFQSGYTCVEQAMDAPWAASYLASERATYGRQTDHRILYDMIIMFECLAAQRRRNSLVIVLLVNWHAETACPCRRCNIGPRRALTHWPLRLVDGVIVGSAFDNV